RHEQPVALAASEADVGADLRQPDLADARAVGGEDMDAVVTVADPAGARPDVPVLVATDPVSEACLAIPLHAGERLRIGKLRAVDVLDPDLALGFRIVRHAGVGDVELLVVG